MVEIMAKEMMEITVVVYESNLRYMLKQLAEAKKKGNESVMIEQGPVAFHVCSSMEVEPV
jgi:hypothetical protein